MAISLQAPDIRELKPRITVFGVGGAGGNAVNNMIESGLLGCEFVVANTDAQALTSSKAERVIQMGIGVTQGLGAGSQPDVGRAAAEEVIDEIRDQLSGAHMCFITAGMGGGTGTGAAPVIARTARDMGILTVGVVTKPFQFEGVRRMRTAESGINELQQAVDTLIVIPNQNLFRVANEKTTFADAFAMADQVLYSGVACITDLMVKEGLINLDFADVRAIMRGMGKAMMGTGEASGEKRANRAAEAAIANPLLDDVSMKGARGLLISITGGNDLTLYELDEAATRIREEVDSDANIILGATFDESLDGIIRVSVVATGIEPALINANAIGSPEIAQTEQRIAEVAERLRAEARARAAAPSAPAASFRPTEAPVARAPAPEPVAHAPMHAPMHPQASAPEPVRMELPPVHQAAGLMRDEVQITPAQPRTAPVYEPAPAPAPEAQMPMASGPFIPPSPAVVRAPRMPRVQDLPMPAQNQIRASRGEEPVQQVTPDAKRTSLLRRLATVGFGGRREDEAGHPAQAPAPAAHAPQPAPRPMPQAPLQQAHLHQAPQHQPMQQAPAPRQAAPQAYAPQGYAPQQPQGYRPAQGNLDPQGRAVPAGNRMMDDDQLEIPAFLRRQAN
ncbi:cell division protein FtsZ [Methylobacterium platani]|uniref:Cell division protein FtsZ n=2 Tax=Methylobacterium platani TaxID=427683 RepID=A0A179S688_9HYPH|nr:cell division protein FtsZ [Methylobacterium platani]KMO13920.1 cell division protein FtsZ [Methylobacterium platani JCM 14648]OAS20036.1 cell division protein FtsZ [Methylobacterium platani]